MKKSLAYWNKRKYGTGAISNLEFKRAVAQRREAEKDEEAEVNRLINKYR